jgi:hypothetical protein
MSSISQLRQGGESQRSAAIREIVDDVAGRIESGLLGETEARRLAGDVRFQMGLIIPDRMDQYDMIYGARFERLIRQFIPGDTRR